MQGVQLLRGDAGSSTFGGVQGIQFLGMMQEEESRPMWGTSGVVDTPIMEGTSGVVETPIVEGTSGMVSTLGVERSLGGEVLHQQQKKLTENRQLLSVKISLGLLLIRTL